MLRLLKSLLPEWIEIIVLADRGFGRTKLARTCQELGMHYVIRIKSEVYVEGAEFRGTLTDLPVKHGVERPSKTPAESACLKTYYSASETRSSSM